MTSQSLLPPNDNNIHDDEESKDLTGRDQFNYLCGAKFSLSCLWDEFK